MPAGIEDRDADVWESLLMVADAAGGDWPERARVAAVALVADSREAQAVSLGVRLLTDLHTVFGEHETLSTEDILNALVAMDDAPWGDLRGKALDARGLARRLAKYGVKPKNVRIDDRICKGYARADLHDPWSRYVADVEDGLARSSKGFLTDLVGNRDGALGAAPGAATSATSATPSREVEPEPDDALFEDF